MNRPIKKSQSGQELSSFLRISGTHPFVLRMPIPKDSGVPIQRELIHEAIDLESSLNPSRLAWHPKEIIAATTLSRDVNSCAVIHGDRSHNYRHFFSGQPNLINPLPQRQFRYLSTHFPLGAQFEERAFEVVEEPEFRAEFKERVERIEKETAIYSSPAAMYLHRDYMVIIAKGIESPKIVVPLILERLLTHGGNWFFALEKITNANPAIDCGDYEAAVGAWNTWAEKNLHFMVGNALHTA